MNAGLELSWNRFFNRDASYAITAIESELPRTRTLRFAVGSSRNARQARPADAHVDTSAVGGLAQSAQRLRDEEGPFTLFGEATHETSPLICAKRGAASAVRSTLPGAAGWRWADFAGIRGNAKYGNPISGCLAP